MWHRTPATPTPHRRGSVIVIVLWSIAISALIASSIQLFAFRQAMFGRESVERVQARWAARGGIEYTMAVLADHSIQPWPDDALAMRRDLTAVSSENFEFAGYDIRHHIDGVDWAGPMDEHAKLNVNDRTTHPMIGELDGMTPDIVDALGDWQDKDDQISTLGVERDYYLNLLNPYEPRNGPLRTITEMELVAGVWPEYFRGEDWNLNGRLDGNENDAAASLPIDEPDSVLDAGWSQFLTVHSRRGGATDSGLPRIWLRSTSPEELMERLGITEDQAQALMAFGQNPTNDLTTLITTPLTQVAAGNDAAGSNAGANPGNSDAPQPTPMAPLEDEQIRAVLAETSIENPTEIAPGKLNINSAPERLLRQVMVAEDDEALVDEIIYLRLNRAEGITSMLDLRDLPGINDQTISRLGRMFDTKSNVFTIASKGRSHSSGLEVEIVAVVDRSTLPVKILEYREQ